MFMSQIVECVANISEGKDPMIIADIAQAIISDTETTLLHIDSGHDANRTVYTFTGTLISLRKSVLQMYEMALHHIDMRSHSGTHPRIGAVDVCPFIPIKGITIQELIPWVNELAQEISKRFLIPVYLYEKSAIKEYRQNLATIRKGEYENLSKKFNNELWQADFGANTDWLKSGATVIGARQFLLAYNINLKTRDVLIAKKIAKQIRGSGYINPGGRRVPGLFPSVKAIGWYIDEYRCAQVSTNLINYKHDSFHQVFDACTQLAQESNTIVTGSELIGLTPLEPLRMAGLHYGDIDMDESELVATACINLGLSDFNEFNPKERVIEYLLENIMA